MNDADPGLYDTPGVATSYRASRGLPAEAVRVWVDAIRTAVAATRVRLAIDVGAGTGRFTRVLAEAVGGHVIAIEPSAGMTAAREPIEDGRATFVRGAGEALPVRTGAADVAQLSMVYHQLRDAGAARRELRRVLRPGGLVLLRTPTHETLDDFAWMRFFPESRAIDVARIPSHAAIVRTFEDAGFRSRRHTVVWQRIAASLTDYVERVRSRAFSSMQAIPDDVWARRFAEFEAHCRTLPDHPIDEPVNLFAFD
jgi:SAM-dependent methyltransferase